MRGMLGFLFYSSITLAPVLIAVSVAGQFLHRDRLIGLARVAVVIGFLVGGVVGWASVPAQWTASLWTTIEAAGNSAKYGESFEHTAERALDVLFLLCPTRRSCVRPCCVCRPSAGAKSSFCTALM